MNWAEAAGVAQAVGTWTSVATVLALAVGGLFALTRYYREGKLRAAELLLNMEHEHRAILPTCLDLEFLPRYERIFVPVILKVELGRIESDEDRDTLVKLDRCLRFFFVCTLLSSDLDVEKTAISRAYYYYVCLLAESDRRQELRTYIARYYKRLDAWMMRHQRCLDEYRKSGTWDATLVVRSGRSGS